MSTCPTRSTAGRRSARIPGLRLPRRAPRDPARAQGGADERGARRKVERLMPTLVLLRHGQSQWNLENRFTGWWDVDLTRPGRRRGARGRASCCATRGFDFDCCFTSVQTRAIRTLHLVARRDGPAVAAGGQGLAAERAPLWRAHRPQQAGDDRQGRRRAGQDLAALLRHRRRRRCPRTARTTSATTAAMPASTCRTPRASRTRSRARCLITRPDRAGAAAPGSACSSPPTAIRCAAHQASVGHRRRGDRRAGNPDRPADRLRARRRS